MDPSGLGVWLKLTCAPGVPCCDGGWGRWIGGCALEGAGVAPAGDAEGTCPGCEVDGDITCPAWLRAAFTAELMVWGAGVGAWPGITFVATPA